MSCAKIALMPQSKNRYFRIHKGWRGKKHKMLYIKLCQEHKRHSGAFLLESGECAKIFTIHIFHLTTNNKSGKRRNLGKMLYWRMNVCREFTSGCVAVSHTIQFFSSAHIGNGRCCRRRSFTTKHSKQTICSAYNHRIHVIRI